MGNVRQTFRRNYWKARPIYRELPHGNICIFTGTLHYESIDQKPLVIRRTELGLHTIQIKLISA